MNCHAPIGGDGVPLAISNPLSGLVQRQQAEIENLVAQIADAHATLTTLNVASEGPHGDDLSLSERIELAVLFPKPNAPAPAKEPFAANDDFLPATSTAPAQRSAIALSIALCASAAAAWALLVGWLCARSA